MKTGKKTIGELVKKPEKPFLAARIPAGLNSSLEKHAEKTGENKTDILINALSVYLGWSQEGTPLASASDRLSVLETRLDELEKLVREPRQTSLLDNLEQPKTKEPDKGKPVIKPNNTIDNKANKVLINREMSQLSGMKYETVRSRHKTEKAIVIGGISYKPVKNGSTCLWDPN